MKQIIKRKCSKVMSLIFAFVLIVSSLYVSQSAEATEGYEEITLADKSEGNAYAAGAQTAGGGYPIGSGDLGGTVFRSSFRFTAITNAVYIGYRSGGGLLVQVQGDGSIGFRWRSSAHDNYAQDWIYISASACGKETFLKEWFELRVAFDFTEKTDTTAIVKATIQIDDCEAVEYTTNSAVKLGMVQRQVYLAGSASEPLYHCVAPDLTGYTPITLEDRADGIYTPGTVNGSAGYNLGNEHTLHQTVFSGEFKFTSTTASDGTIYLGGTGVSGIRIQPQGGDELNVSYRTNVTGHNIHIPMGSITPAEVGIDSFVNTWIKLQVGIKFMNPSSTNTGLEVIVQVNDNYTETYQIAYQNDTSSPLISALMRYVTLQGGAVNPLHHRVHEAYEPEIVTMLDKTGAAYQPGRATAGIPYDLGAANGLDLDNTRFVGRIKFSSLTYSDNALFVGMYGGGVRIMPKDDDSLEIYWRVKQLPEFNQAVELEMITAEAAGVTTFKDQWLDLSIEFHFTNKAMETTDLNMTIAIGDTFEKTYSVSGAALVGLTRYVYLQGTATSPVYHESPIELEYYNLNNVSDGYLLSGRGDITVNHQAKSAGDTLTNSGDYIIRCKLYGTYVKHVILYRPGDAHVDDASDVRDLVAVMKAVEGNTLSTKAAQKGADANQDNYVNDQDAVKVRQFLLGIDEQVTRTLSYQEGVMPVAGYYGPYRTTDAWGESYDLITEDMYKKIADVGINLINYTSADYKVVAQRQDIIDNLSLAQKYGIGMYVLDSRISGDITSSQLATYIGDYAKYTSYKGNFVIDEPYTEGYSKITDGVSEWSQGIKRLDDYVACGKKLNSYANTLGYINLNPIAARLKVNSQDTLSDAYKTYIDSYLTTNARLLSWDYYVWDQKLTGSINSTLQYFENMKIAKEKADAANIPFWTFIQAGSNWNGSQENGIVSTEDNNSIPSKAELLWNVNTSLAYGAKGIQYFTLVQPAYFAFTEDETGNKTYDYRRNGLIGADGTPNAWYDYAKEANQQIAIVDEYLLNAKSLAVITSGETNAQAATGTTDTYESIKISTDSKGRGALAGVFDYLGKTALYVVNYDTSGDSNNQVTINFGSNKKYKVISGEQLVGSENDEQVGTSCTLTLVDGGAALIVLQ